MEAVLEAWKKQGPLSPICYWRLYLQEELVLCLQRLSLKQVKYRGPPSPFVCSWRVALSSADFLLRWRPKNASKSFSRSSNNCRKLIILVIVSQTRYRSLRRMVSTFLAHFRKILLVRVFCAFRVPPRTRMKRHPKMVYQVNSIGPNMGSSGSQSGPLQKTMNIQVPP